MVQPWMFPAALVGLAYGVVGLAVVAVGYRAAPLPRSRLNVRMLAGIVVVSAALALALWP
jgi:hypothetical protein